MSAFSMAKSVAFTTKLQLPQRQARRSQRCNVVAEEKRGLDFTANKNASLGFTESDSAGQTNIFAVEPKQYVAGSKTDKVVGAGDSTAAGAAVAGSVAAGAVVAGLLLLGSSSTPTVDSVAPTGDFVTLTQYSSQFSAELATPPAAPALTE